VAIIAAGTAVTLRPGPAELLIAASVLAGTVRGLFTLTEATLVADYWGSGRYAPANGAATAAAGGSYPFLFVILAATAPRPRAG
jgi:hypothetical protein